MPFPIEASAELGRGFYFSNVVVITREIMWEKKTCVEVGLCGRRKEDSFNESSSCKFVTILNSSLSLTCICIDAKNIINVISVMERANGKETIFCFSCFVFLFRKGKTGENEGTLCCKTCIQREGEGDSGSNVRLLFFFHFFKNLKL